MRGPYGLEIIDNCQMCLAKKSSFFCQMTPEATKEFNSLKSSSAYPAGATLFLEKQDCRGIFILCQGEVKLTISSREGKTLILRIARAGEILSLMSALSGKPYEVTAETLRPCQVVYLRRDDFLHFVAQYPEASHGMITQLSSNYYGACEQLRTVVLSASAQSRLAKLLLDLSTGAEETKFGTRIRLPLTHEEIGEFIGSSRETVTRTLSEFRTQNLVTLKGSILLISNRAGLESFVTA